MPIGAITMILANVGLQIYNNWCGSRQNKQLQQKREEFERAAKDRNTQRMWQLMREGQELTRRLEEEKHQQRLEELKNDIGSLLQKLTYAATINNWPLNVLPIVMKNQALGNLLANQEESIALHCIFTPSNSIEFNRTVFPRIEEALETYCNQHWSVMSEHPILFYSGAWKSQQVPTEIQIDSMRTALSNLPTLVITPFFRPNDGKLVFHVRIWGVGSSSSDEFSIPEIEPIDFQRNYQTGDDYVNDADLTDNLIEDLVPYLQCLIGYMADTYFWSSLGKAPHLPLLVTNGTINTDGMKYLVDDSRTVYEGYLQEYYKQNNSFEDYSIDLTKGLFPLWDKKRKREEIAKAILSYCNRKTNESHEDVSEALKNMKWSLYDKHFVEVATELISDIQEEGEYSILFELKETFEKLYFNYAILSFHNKNHLEHLAKTGDPVALYRLGEFFEYGMKGVCDKEKASQYYEAAAKNGLLLAKIKCGMIAYQNIPINEENILYATVPIQMDVLYSEGVLNSAYSQTQMQKAIERVRKTVAAHPYAHAGLIYNLACMMKKEKLDLRVINNMFHVANVMGYTI